MPLFYFGLLHQPISSQKQGPYQYPQALQVFDGSVLIEETIYPESKGKYWRSFNYNCFLFFSTSPPHYTPSAQPDFILLLRRILDPHHHPEGLPSHCQHIYLILLWTALFITSIIDLLAQYSLPWDITWTIINCSVALCNSLFIQVITQFFKWTKTLGATHLCSTSNLNIVGDKE